MKTLSLKLEDNIFEETEQMTGYLKKTRNRYINEALNHYNKMQRKRMLARQIEMESGLVAQDSMIVLNEFEEMEDESQAI
jgi:predicted transcriptional regulator